MSTLADPKIAAFWAAFCDEAGVTGAPFEIDRFGDTPELADALAGLILTGEKQATCALARWYQPPHGERPPAPGDHSIVLDGAGAPAAVVRTTQVEIKPVCAVDAAFAFDEGEGDKSLGYWLTAHRAFFRREADGAGFAYSDDLPAVFERFERVWPPKTRL